MYLSVYYVHAYKQVKKNGEFTFKCETKLVTIFKTPPHT